MVINNKKKPPPTEPIIEQQQQQQKQQSHPLPLPLPKSVETCPSFRSGHLPSVEDLERLRTLAAPHVESFNYFLEYGLARGIKDIEPYEICLVDPKRLLRGTSTDGGSGRASSNSIEWDNVTSVEFWVENVKIGKPINQGATSGGNSFGLSGNKLLPRECRERGLMYSGPIRGDFCFRVIQRRNGAKIAGKPQRFSRLFGNMPIMTLSKACHLHGTTPKQLVQMKEEVRSRERVKEKGEEKVPPFLFFGSPYRMCGYSFW
jgi:DNA-directed RNA polymerase beta subunit